MNNHNPKVQRANRLIRLFGIRHDSHHVPMPPATLNRLTKLETKPKRKRKR